MVLLLAAATGSSAQKKMLLAGSGWNKVAMIDKKTQKLVWIHDLGPKTECNCLDYTRRGEVVYAYGKGARLVTKDHRTVWDFQVDEGELHTASVLPDGGFLLAVTGKPARIIELDKDGKIRKEITYDTKINSLHGQFRQVRKSAAGTYLLPLMGRHVVVELDADGKELKTYPAEGNTFAVLELKDGNLLISCGDAHSIMKVDRKTGEVIQHIRQDDIEGVAFQFVAEIASYRDNLFIANWLGHSKVKNQPLVVELDKDGKVVWTLAGNPEIRDVSAICPVK